jgi:GTP cyclohydrolase I
MGLIHLKETIMTTRIFPPLTSSNFSFVKDPERKAAPAMEEAKPALPAAQEIPAPEPVVLEPAPVSQPAPQPVPLQNIAEPVKAAPTDEDAQQAFKTLLQWMGEDVAREGLKDTPARVTRAWKEFFVGYKEDPKDHLKNPFANTEGYNEMVCLENIRLESYCEHHMVPITGTAFVAYIPNAKIAGLSKIARVVEGYAKRLQVQEKLTRQIAVAMNDMLAPRGVAVAIRSEHQCLSTRGIHKPGSDMFTFATFGVFETNPAKRAEFLDIVNRKA